MKKEGIADESFSYFKNWEVLSSMDRPSLFPIDRYKKNVLMLSKENSRIFEIFLPAYKDMRCYFTPYQRIGIESQDCQLVKKFASKMNFDLEFSTRFRFKCKNGGKPAGKCESRIRLHFGHSIGRLSTRYVEIRRFLDIEKDEDSLTVVINGKEFYIPIDNDLLYENPNPNSWMDEEYRFKLAVRTREKEGVGRSKVFVYFQDTKEKGNEHLPNFSLLGEEYVGTRFISSENRTVLHRLSIDGRYWNPYGKNQYVDVRNMRFVQFDMYPRKLLLKLQAEIVTPFTQEKKNRFSEKKMHLMELLEGTKLEDFEPLRSDDKHFRRIGKSKSGGHYGINSQVYEVCLKKDETRTPLVLKVLYNTTHHGSSSMYRYLVKKEQLSVEQLPFHDNICHILHHFVGRVNDALFPGFLDTSTQNERLKGRTAFFVMLKYEENLSQFARRKSYRFEELEYLGMLKDLLVGLYHIEKNWIVHRDIKLDNIFRNERNGELIISDFGVHINQIVDRTYKVRSDSYTSGGAYVCRPPEIRNPKSDMYYDFEKADIFAFGIVGFTILANGVYPTEYDKVSGEELKKQLDGHAEYINKERLETLLVDNIIKASFEERFSVLQVLEEVVKMLEKMKWVE